MLRNGIDCGLLDRFVWDDDAEYGFAKTFIRSCQPEFVGSVDSEQRVWQDSHMVLVVNLLVVAARQVVAGSSPPRASLKTGRAFASVWFVVIGFRFVKQDGARLTVWHDLPLTAEALLPRSTNWNHGLIDREALQEDVSKEGWS